MIEFMEPLVQRYGYWLVGVVICLESMGLPLPGESLLIAAALYAAATGNIAIELVVLAAAVGAIVGDNLGYLVGQRLGKPALERWGPKVMLTVPRQRLGQYLFFRYGGVVVFFGRFVAFLRVFAALLAGANGMAWGRFLFWNALGGVVWTCLYGFGAYFLGQQALRLAGSFGLVMGAVGVVVVVGAVWFLKHNEARVIARAEAAMRVHEAEAASKTAP